MDPKRWTVWASRLPEGERRRSIIPTSTTTEMKYGAYATICVKRLKRACFTSLMASARISAAGDPNDQGVDART